VLNAQVTVEGKPVSLAISDATACTEGEFSGNIDLSVTVTPEWARTAVVENIRLRVAGAAGLLDVLGSGETPNGVGLTFYTPDLIGAGAVPRQIEVLWGARAVRLGGISCSRG
jgi:hypothetical protein